MNNRKKIQQVNVLAQALGVIGVLFFIAMAFGIIEWKYAMFGGLACFIIAPAVKRIALSTEES